MTTAYPLAWPEGWPRMPVGLRRPAQFRNQMKGRLSVADASKRVLDELRRLGVQYGDEIISTNLVLRLDGLPRSDQRAPEDPGAAVYWRVGRDDVAMKVMAIDRYNTVADNLAAIAATLDAMRAIERHGGGQILERAFTGFTALPAPKDWRAVMGFTPGEAVTVAQLNLRFRSLAAKHHPDLSGGSSAAMSELNLARDKALKEIGP